MEAAGSGRHCRQEGLEDRQSIGDSLTVGLRGARNCYSVCVELDTSDDHSMFPNVSGTGAREASWCIFDFHTSSGFGQVADEEAAADADADTMEEDEADLGSESSLLWMK